MTTFVYHTDAGVYKQFKILREKVHKEDKDMFIRTTDNCKNI